MTFEAPIVPTPDSENNQGFQEHDPSTFLGEGFDAQFFADKTDIIRYGDAHPAWNELLEQEDLSDRKVEEPSFLDGLFAKLSGKNDAPLLYPVFIDGLQRYYQEQGIPSDHVTPDRMDKFYKILVREGGTDPREE